MLAAPFLQLGVVEGRWQLRTDTTDSIPRDISIRSADKAIGATLPLYVYEKTYLRPIGETEKYREREKMCAGERYNRSPAFRLNLQFCPAIR